MSTSYVLIVFALVIVLMIVLISKCKDQRRHGNPSVGIYSGHCPGDTLAGHEGTINSGFSSTLKVWPS